VHETRRSDPISRRKERCSVRSRISHRLLVIALWRRSMVPSWPFIIVSVKLMCIRVHMATVSFEPGAILYFFWTLLLFSDLKIAVRTNSVFRSRLSTPPILFARSTRRPPQLIHLLMTLKKLAREEVGVLSGSTALTACNFSGALQFSVSRVHRSC
jgi:hypothetical protein